MVGLCMVVPNTKPYELTHIYDHDYNNLDIRKFDDKQLIQILSICNHDESLVKPIKTEHQYLLEMIKMKEIDVKMKNLKMTNLIDLKMTNLTALEKVRILIQLLSSRLSNTYETRIEVGQCLHNIDLSLLISWIEFSQKSSKFKEMEYEKNMVSYEIL